MKKWKLQHNYWEQGITTSSKKLLGTRASLLVSLVQPSASEALGLQAAATRDRISADGRHGPPTLRKRNFLMFTPTGHLLTSKHKNQGNWHWQADSDWQGIAYFVNYFRSWRVEFFPQLPCGSNVWHSARKLVVRLTQTQFVNKSDANGVFPEQFSVFLLSSGVSSGDYMSIEF